MIASTSIIGIKMAQELEGKYYEMKYFRQILFLLESEIKYSRVFLSDAFQNISSMVKEPYKLWMRQMCLRLEERMDGNFSSAWRETIDEYLIETKLPLKQKEQIKELGNYLGNLDVNLQIKHIHLLNEQIELAMTEMREQLEGKKRIYRCIGVMSGIFIAILLI